MTKRVLITVIVAVVIFAGILIFSFVRSPGGTDTGYNVPGDETELAPITREDAPRNVVVPDAGSENVPENVAVPQQVSSAPGFTLRKFALRIEDGKFSPDTVIVNVGDTVDLSITAVDGDYDFTQPDFGFKAAITRGTTQSIQFGATAAGQFKFFCASCGGPEKGPVGTLVIAPSE